MSDLSDAALLTELLSEHDEELSETEREAFAGMAAGLLDGRRALSVKQREWAEGVYWRFVPQYENLVSEGKVPRGKEVPLPEVLTRLPKKPPGRS